MHCTLDALVATPNCILSHVIPPAAAADAAAAALAGCNGSWDGGLRVLVLVTVLQKLLRVQPIAVQCSVVRILLAHQAHLPSCRPVPYRGQLMSAAATPPSNSARM